MNLADASLGKIHISHRRLLMTFAPKKTYTPALIKFLPLLVNWNIPAQAGPPGGRPLLSICEN